MSCSYAKCESASTAADGVTKKLTARCNRCRLNSYCNKQCLLSDWKDGGHKRTCGLFVKLHELMRKQNMGPSRETTEEPKLALQDAELVVKLNSLKESSRKTFRFVRSIGSIQKIMSENFVRRAKGLPPLGPDYVYTYPVEVVGSATPAECAALWMRYAVGFSKWMTLASSKGYVFDFSSAAAAQMDEIHEGIKLLLEMEPKETDGWRNSDEAIVIATMLSGICRQKYYLERMFLKGHPLRQLLHLLNRWTTWRGPSEHEWHNCCNVIAGALIEGIDLSRRVYQCVYDNRQLQPLRPILSFWINYCLSRREPIDYDIPETDTEDPQDVESFLEYLQRASVKDYKNCTVVKRCFPDLDISPKVLRNAEHYNTKVQEFIQIHPQLASSILSHDDLFVFQKLIDCC